MQNRMQSLVEAWTSTVVGFFITILAQMILFPLYGIEMHWTSNLQIAIILTLVSLLRSYFMRRAFNRIYRHNMLNKSPR